MNKQSMWFLTLFSLVLVLGVYYVTMPSDLLSTKTQSLDNYKEVSVNVSEADALIAMRATRDEEVSLEIEKLESVLTNDSSSIEEKNKAFEDLRILNLAKSKESQLEEKIENEFGIKSYIEINKDNVRVVIKSKEHDVTLANNLMRSIQEAFESKMYIIIEFE